MTARFRTLTIRNSCWCYFGNKYIKNPWYYLVSPQVRKKGRTGWWFVKAYRRRWGVEDATRSIKQQFSLEQFLVRSWRSICRLLCFVGLAFYWLNSWGEESYNKLLEPLLNHPSRLPKQVSYLFIVRLS
jgi:hypothetical protein